MKITVFIQPLKVISVYISGAFELILKCLFSLIYLWFCATFTIVFYGVDRKEGDQSWGWIEVDCL